MRSSTQPSHRVYAVTNGRTCWLDIGAAWMHKDGKGFDLHLETMPFMAAEIIARAEGAKGPPPLHRAHR